MRKAIETCFGGFFVIYLQIVKACQRHRGSGGTRSAQAVRSFWAAGFFLHRMTGVHELRERVRS